MRTFDEVRIEHYTKHPEELDILLNVSFEDYAAMNDIRILSDTLNLICKVKNVAITVEPEWRSIINTILVLGYRLSSQKCDI